MTIFDEGERQGDDPPDRLIGSYDYLNSSGRIEAERVRALVESWSENYPRDQIESLARRLKSRDNTNHLSAFFELAIHELMQHLGIRAAQIEPTLENGRSPDFQFQMPDGTDFYLEASVASGRSDEDSAAERRLSDVLQAIDEIESPNFFLDLHRRGQANCQIRLRALRQSLQRFVNSLNYDDAIRAARNDVYVPPVWQHEEHGLHLTVRPIPKNTPRLGGRAIAGEMLAGGMIEPAAAIKAKILRKATRYGQLNRPFVIAVNAMEQFACRVDVIDALFGSQVFIVGENGRIRNGRDRDGVWFGQHGPQHTRVSAVLFVERLTPWSVGQRKTSIIINPWAEHELPDLPAQIERTEIIGEQECIREGSSLAEIFGLPDFWPEQAE